MYLLVNFNIITEKVSSSDVHYKTAVLCVKYICIRLSEKKEIVGQYIILSLLYKLSVNHTKSTQLVLDKSNKSSICVNLSNLNKLSVGFTTILVDKYCCTPQDFVTVVFYYFLLPSLG